MSGSSSSARDAGQTADAAPRADARAPRPDGDAPAFESPDWDALAATGSPVHALMASAARAFDDEPSDAKRWPRAVGMLLSLGFCGAFWIAAIALARRAFH